MTRGSVWDLKPADTPDYMAPAWLGCIRWAMNEPGVMAAFRAESGNNYQPPRNAMDAMVDAATGADWAFIEAFIKWVNVNVWGPIDGPQMEVES